jgi:hypothetical protein
VPGFVSSSAGRRVARPRLARALRIVGVNVGILALGVLGLEIAFGHWLSPNRMNRLNIPRQVSRISDASGLYPSPDRLIRYSRDAHGFRGAYDGVDRIDLLTIGGSATDQRYIGDGQTWQDVLARAFRENGRHVSVVNAGVDGQSTYGHIKNFEWWFPFVPNLKVRYFVFYVGLNDLFKDDGYARDRLVRTSSPLWALLEQNSALYQAYRTLNGMYQAGIVAKLGHGRIRFTELGWTSTPYLHDHEAILRDRRAAYRERLLTLGQKVAELGSGLICVTQPSRAYRKEGGTVRGVATLGTIGGMTVSGVDYYHMIQVLRRTTLETCGELGGRAIDLANEVDWDDDDFYDFAHNTPRGAEKIGRYLYMKLRDLP